MIYKNIFNLIAILIVLTCISDCSARVSPAYLTPCPGLKPDCLKTTAQEALPLFAKGVPELGVVPLDPLRDDRLVVTLPGGFDVEINNGSTTGLSKCKFESVSFEGNELDYKMRCNLTMRGQYKAAGRILIVAINGEGNAKVKIINAFIHTKVRFEDTIRDGIVYYEMKDFDSKLDFGDRVIFSLTNLFKGNPEISEAVLQFLNQNWKQVAEEFGQPLVDKLVAIVYNIVKVFFEKVPKDELFIK